MIAQSFKQHKPARDSLVSLPGSPSVKGEGSFKINIAQSELQACGARLSNKECELDGLRLSGIRGSLYARCKAMVECGWTWGDVGKEGIRALERLNAPNQRCAGWAWAESPGLEWAQTRQYSTVVSQVLAPSSVFAMLSESGYYFR
jgi:hypothetical protein